MLARAPLVDAPDRGLLAAAAIAWVAVVALHMTGGMTADPGHLAGHAPGGAAVEPFTSSMAAWSAMSVAMMMPVAIPLARHVHRGSLRRRRARGVLLSVGAYLAVWVAVGVPVVTASGAFGAEARAVTAGVLLVLSAAWMASSARSRAAAAVPAVVPLGLRGIDADLAAARLGALHGARCMVTCGPVMAAVAFVAGALHLPVMLAASAVIASDRLTTGRWSRLASVAVLVLAGAVVVVRS